MGGSHIGNTTTTSIRDAEKIENVLRNSMSPNSNVMRTSMSPNT
jgi:hypothetical protein